MNDQKKQLSLITIQLIATSIYIGSLVLSFYLTYNDKLMVQNKKGIFSLKQSRNFSIFNRFLVVAITLSFLYINYENEQLIKKRGKDPSAAHLQVVASELTTLATIIVLYVVLSTQGQQYTIISGVANPNL